MKIVKKRKQKGFTLVELLVVIAIIAMLLSVLMPSLQSARRQARVVICKSNIGQMCLSATMYANDNSSQFPYKTDQGNANTYVYYTPRFRWTDFRHLWVNYVPGYKLVKRYEVHKEDFAPGVMYCPSAVGTNMMDSTKSWPYKNAWGAGYDVYQMGYEYFNIGGLVVRPDVIVWQGTLPTPKSTLSKGSTPLFGDPIIYGFDLSAPYFRYANHWRSSTAREWVPDDLRSHQNEPTGVNNGHVDGSVKWYNYPDKTETFTICPSERRRNFWGKQ